ncbi:MAG TPA: PfkB family carbohydrate kinase [Gemmataceae bacterium]|nr:PfkB family carbohydrate kinase [Gemmataceae bacterium]
MSQVPNILSTKVVDKILERLPSLTLGVVGDLFLDRYLDLDARLTEPSIETGLDAFQVVRVRSLPGAAGTIINNLVALGVGRVCVISVVGDDGEGYELGQALRALKVVDARWVMRLKDRRTPTYTKPMLEQPGQPARELNRLDIKNRTPTPAVGEEFVLEALAEAWPQVDALLALDQVSEPNCGVINKRVRSGLTQLGQAHPQKLILADSREQIGLFRGVSAKPNQAECARAVLGKSNQSGASAECVAKLAQMTGRPVFCTCGAEGILLADPTSSSEGTVNIPAYPVSGPTDIVGAGDSTSAGIACAVAAGASLAEAAAFGNLVASITVQQIGTTGTASPTQVRQRWSEVLRTDAPR